MDSKYSVKGYLEGYSPVPLFTILFKNIFIFMKCEDTNYHRYQINRVQVAEALLYLKRMCPLR